MKFNFRTKFILANLIVVFITMIILAIFVIQGIMYYNFKTNQDQLIKMGSEAQVYITQEIKAAGSSASNSTIFTSRALTISEDLAKINNLRVLLFDTDGVMVADSANVDISDDIKYGKEIEIALGLEAGKSVAVYKRVDSVTSIYYAMPVFVDNEMVGVVSFIKSLEFTDAIVMQILLLFLGASIIGFITIFKFSSYLSGKILQPVRDLADSTKRLSEGSFSELLHYDVNDEIGDLTRNFNKMSHNINDKLNLIENEKQKFSSIIASINDGVIALDSDLKTFVSNSKASEILGLENGKINTETMEDIPELVDMIDFVFRERKDISKQFDYKGKQLYVFANLIMNKDTQLGILLVLRDITKIKELEDQQRLFISSVSHELRTPLTTIIGYTDLLLRRGTENKELVTKSLATINTEGKRLLRLVSDLLDLSKYANAQFQMIMADVDLNHLLEEVISQMKMKGSKFNLDIFYNRTELPLIKGDYDRLKQVFINILDNAIKYSNPGDIIKVIATQNEKHVEISIRDHGSGIPDDVKDRIFDPFYRVDEDRSRDMGGTGLGLAIVKDIVERHGGSITVESQINEGTMISIDLPVT
ncbi:MAG: cell wall metabolism sensor histidine kinase WalK [Eubacteriaceae bacterium]|nr:cell wall metabolism sensor histidine kinase WalK [Eubacteriaceae bacterium]